MSLSFGAGLFTDARAVDTPSSPDAPTEGALPFWPEVVDTVRIRTPLPDVRQRMVEGTGSATYIPLGTQIAGDRSIADLLSRVAGLHVHRFGGLGSFSLASVRGSTPGQVQVYLDDMPLANAATGVVNLSLLPLAESDHAEIYRGPQTLLLGGPPAAGVIRLVSPDRVDVPLSLAVGGASFGTRSLRGQWGHQRGRVGVYLGGQWRKSEGDYPYLNRNGTRHNLEDDRVVRRANNRFEDRSALARIRFSASQSLRFDYTLHSLSRESGIPGPESLPTTSTDYKLRQQRHQVGVELKNAYPFGSRAAGRPRIGAFLFHERTTDRFRNLLGEVGLGYADQRNVTRNTGARVRGTFPWVPAGQQLDVALFANREKWEPTDLLRGFTPPTQVRNRRSGSLAHRAIWRSWMVSLGYTRDWVEDGPIQDSGVTDGTKTTRRFKQTTVGVRWNLSEYVSLRASQGQFFRTPTFPELFGQNGLQEGNPDLVPETGPHWDAGFVLRGTDALRSVRTGVQSTAVAWRIEGTYFESLTRNKIVLLQNSQRTVQAHNFERAWIHGIELSGSAEWEAPRNLNLSVQIGLTRQKTKNLGRSPTYRGKQLPTLPELEGALRTAASWKTWHGEYAVEGRGSTFRDRYNSASLKAPGYIVHEITLEREFQAGRIRLRGAVRNLTDRRVQDIDAYPLPGRSYLVELIARAKE